MDKFYKDGMGNGWTIRNVSVLQNNLLGRQWEDS